MSNLRLFATPKRRKTEATRGATLHVEVGRRSCWLHGPHVKVLLDRAQIDARQWDPGRRCWMVSVSRGDDVIAAAEHWQQRVVTVEAVER